MPIYHNANPDQMTFELGGERYKLPSGAECEIPRNLEYCVAARGLALTKGRAPSADAPVVEPTPEVPARVVLPPGVEVGPRRDGDDEDDAEVAEGDDSAEAHEGAAAVDAAVSELAAAGVTVPGAQPQGRRGRR